MPPLRAAILRSVGLVAILAACAGSVDTGPPAPRTLPDRIVLPGISPIQIGEPFQARGFRRVPRGEMGFPGNVGQGPLYEAQPDPSDSLRKIWVRTGANGRVRCIWLQGTQTYPVAFDSVSHLLSQTPVWSDSSGAAKQAVWSDGYVRWWVAGHWHPAVRYTVITIIAVEPVGKPYDPNDFEAC